MRVIHTKSEYLDGWLLVAESVAAVRSPDDDTNNGDTADNAEDNGDHLEIISSLPRPQWQARCVIVAEY